MIASLSPEFAVEVRDLLIRPPADAPYDTLKAELIKRTAASAQRKLQQLISGKELGDRKPTQLLRRMQQLLGDYLRPSADNNAFLKELFLQRLPANVRMVLASADDTTDLAKLADMADKVIEVAAPSVSAIAHTSSDTEVEKLQAEVTRLADLVTSSLNTAFKEAAVNRGDAAPTAPPPLTLCNNHRTVSAGTTRNLVKLPRSARSPAAGETPRPDTRGDRCHRPNFKSPLFCK